MNSVYIVMDKLDIGGRTAFKKYSHERDVFDYASNYANNITGVLQVFEDGSTKQLDIQFDGKLKLVEKKKKEDNVKIVKAGSVELVGQSLPYKSVLESPVPVVPYTFEQAEAIKKSGQPFVEEVDSAGNVFLNDVPVIAKPKPKMNVIVLADVVGNLKTAHKEAYDLIEKLFYKKIAEKGYDINLVSRRALKSTWNTEVAKLDPFPVQCGQDTKPAWLSGISDARHLLSNKKEYPTAVLLLSGGNFYKGDEESIKNRIRLLANDVEHIQLYEFGSGYGETFYSVVGNACNSPELRRKITRNLDNDLSELYKRDTLYIGRYLKDAKN